MKTSLRLFSYNNIQENQRKSKKILFFIFSKKAAIQLTFLFLLMLANPLFIKSQTSYSTQTGTLGTTYSWIDCSSGTSIIVGDDAQATISWPFSFQFYDDTYTTSNSLSVCTNGFIRLDGNATTSFSTASNYTLSSSSTELGQIIATSVYDCDVSSTSWVKYTVTGTSPNRILTIEYNHLEIDYNDHKYADIQVSIYETSNKIVLKLGTDNITASGADMGIHSGVAGNYEKWQEVGSGTNNAWVEYTPNSSATPSANWNYVTTTGTIGTTYNWIDCSSGTSITSGDDTKASVNWPFSFSFYDNTYTTANSLSVSTNGFIRLDDVATVNYTTASQYDLTSTATNLGQIIALAVYDTKVGDNGGYAKYLVTGTAPNRVFTIEYNNLEISYNIGRYADVEVSFYESSNKIVLMLGPNDDVITSGADMGIHSGVDGYFNKWQEVASGTNNTWIEYSLPVEVIATSGLNDEYYLDLKSAFDKINDGTHKGEITIKLHASIDEDATAKLNASGDGNANYSSINIYPTRSGVSIIGDINAPLIDLNGADNVSIDGRVNASGSSVDMSIINTSSASVTATSTIRFINSAQNNVIKYCNIKGSQSLASSGILFFSTTSNSSGNSNNTIINNNITTYDDANRPVNTIYSYGTAGKSNNGNTIKNNNIYNFTKQSSASNGIYLYSNSSDWTIDGNSFYETTSFASTGTVTYNAIKINNTNGNNFSIVNNYIGGSDAQCGSTAWTKTNSRSNVFNGIYLKVGTSTASSVQNNTIKNFSWNNSSSGSWSAININSGAVDIGTTTANKIGDTTGTSSIYLSNSSITSSGTSYGIYVNSTGTVNIKNNLIGSIKTATSGSVSYSFIGIYKTSGIAGNIEIADNKIGSIGTPNSIHASTVNTNGAAQNVYGINVGGSGTNVISENTVSNLFCAHQFATATSGQVVGILTTKGTNEVTSNTIENLSTSSPNSSSYSGSAIIGISQLSTTAGQNVSNNTIKNLNSTYTGTRTVNVIGIYYAGGTSGTNVISGNYINNLTMSSTAPYTSPATITGIKIRAGSNTISNNVISLGYGTTTTEEIIGIDEYGSSGNNNNLYFNTVYIGGTTSGNIASSYALYNSSNNNTRDYRNNILSNYRSGGSSGNHYAIRIAGTSNLTIDYNDYYVSGTSTVLGKFSSTDKTDLASWQSATSQDANSVNTDPVFLNAGGSDHDNYISSVSLTGVTGTGITTDFNSVSRSSTPKIGAFETTSEFIWTGTTSTDFATTTNWQGGNVPPNGASISFDASCSNNCVLDQDRTLKTITNTSSKKLDLNGHILTLTGSIASNTTNQIDASASSSGVIFNGTDQQNIPTGAFVSNTINSLTLNNDNGLTQNGDIIVGSNFTLTLGSYSIGSNTLTLNGIIASTSGTLQGGSSSNIVIGGSGSANLPSVDVNDITINRATGVTLDGDLDVDGTLSLTSGTLTIGANTITISGSSPARLSGDIDASNSSSTIIFDNSSAITLPSSMFSAELNDLTIDGAGITSGSSFTVNGTLNLAGSNPSSSKGLLDMSTDTLSMGVNSSTIGDGDVSGIIKRNHTFTKDSLYTFGSQYTTISFIDANTKPTWIVVKVELGSTPSWSPWTPAPNGKVNRVYKVSCSNNSSTSQANIDMKYLTSELDATYNDENKLVFWHKFTSYGGGTPHEHGKSIQDLTHHYIGVTGLTFGVAASTDIDDSQIGIAYSVSTKNTWKGEVAGHETEWESSQNWTAGNVPTSTDDVLIPSGLAHYPSLTSSSNAVAGTIEIETGASITANSYDITVSGYTGAWINNGTFYPGTGTVTFDHGVSSEYVTVSGTTDFYNVHIGANTTMTPLTGCTFRIEGTASGTPTSASDWTSNNCTVEYNGANQTINNPTGIGSGTGGYYKLILSGTGTKTMPNTSLNIVDDFIITGKASVTAQSSISVGNELEIQSGASFSTGNYDHTVGGNFDVNGTFTAVSGHKITLNGTTSQTVYGDSSIVFEGLTINNSSGVVAQNSFTVNGALTLSSGTLNVGPTTLTLNGSISRTSGNLNFNGQSSLELGGSTAFNFTSSYFSTDPSFDSLTINNTAGVIIARDATVNTVLDLESSNPSSGTIGTLDMSSYTLSMGASATTIGDGDLTGIVKRTTLLPNIEYTFGNKNTSIFFANYGTIPTEISVKIKIGTAPTWGTNPVKRIYEVKQTGASGTLATIKGHYLDSELNGNTEQNLIDMTYVIPTATYEERGKSNLNTTENWITLDNTNFGNLPSSFGVMELGFGEPTSSVITWDGSTSTDWDEPTNWTPAIAPSSSYSVIIPDASTTTYDPTLPASSTIKTIEIQSNGILNSGASSELTIVGDGGAWINNGTFNPSTGKVTFNHGVVSEIATIAGTSDFYDIEVGANTTLQPVAGSYLSISGSGSADPTSVIDFSKNNTVEWKGGAQTIVNPQGINGNDGYYNLIISGSGTKTMPTSALDVGNDLTVSGTTTAVAADSINITGDLSIGSGSTFGAGTSTIKLKGNFDNQGTFTTGINGELYLVGDSSAQTISGSSTITFNKLRLSNPLGITFNTDITIDNKILLCDGAVNVGANTLTLNGTIYNPAGNLNLGSSSNLSFGGTAAIIISSNLFGGTASLNNLTINRSGGVTLGNEDINVNGVLTLTSGTLTIGANTLTISGSSPTLSSGNIDASNSSANMVFNNSSSITLPSSLFTGDINNLKISGSGGIVSNDDLSISGVLNLYASNPSATIGILDMNGTTLDMGVNATTIGDGDVTGIVRRQHTFTDGVEYTFGNQYTTINFLGVSGGVKPAWLSCKIELGSAPVWRTTNVKRVYSFAQAAGGTDRTHTKLHYLESELNASESDESQLTIWNDYDGLTTGNNTFVNGKTTNSTSENWVELVGMATDFIAPATTFAKQYGIGYTNVTTITWTGLGSSSYPGDWSLPGHWSGGVPTENDDVLIPSTLPSGSCGYPDKNLLDGISPAVAKTITIEASAQIDASTFDITVNGDGSAWVNNGTFVAGSKNVTFDNGNPDNTVTITGDMDFNNVIITDKTKVVPATNSNISISGNLTCNGSMSSTNSYTLTFNSNSNQTISGNGTINFSKLTVNKSSGSVELSAPINVDNTLTLTSGNIVTDNTHSLTLGTSATVSGGSNTSYVDGPMIKEGTSDFVFPVGNNSKFARIGIVNPTGSFKAQYYYSQNAHASDSIESTLTKVSLVEYWDLEPVSNASLDKVTLYFDNQGESGITDPSLLKVAHWAGDVWEDLDNSAYGSNYVTSLFPPSSFSPFAIATNNNVKNPLPVELISFDSKCNNESVILQWKTASEKNNANFIIERSFNAEDWTAIGDIAGAGNSNTIQSYQLEDHEPNSTFNYYRLKQIDYDGHYTYSNIISAECMFGNSNNINLYPNPANRIVTIAVNNSLIGSEYTISNDMGQTITSGIIDNDLTHINIQELKTGVYILVIKTINGEIYNKKLVVN
jgi:hypothetical protein